MSEASETSNLEQFFVEECKVRINEAQELCRALRSEYKIVELTQFTKALRINPLLCEDVELLRKYQVGITKAVFDINYIKLEMLSDVQVTKLFSLSQFAIDVRGINGRRLSHVTKASQLPDSIRNDSLASAVMLDLITDFKEHGVEKILVAVPVKLESMV